MTPIIIMPNGVRLSHLFIMSYAYSGGSVSITSMASASNGSVSMDTQAAANFFLNQIDNAVSLGVTLLDFTNSSMPCITTADTNWSDSGQTVNVTGIGFQNGCVVSVNGAACATTFTSYSSISFTVGAKTGANPVDLVVKNPDGGTFEVDGFYQWA